MPPRRSSRTSSPNWFRRLTVGGAVLVALYFAIQGGEYATTDLLDQRNRKTEYRAAIDSLQLAVDSLEALTEALRTDRKLQERIAREEFGMIRPGEILYRFVEPEE